MKKLFLATAAALVQSAAGTAHSATVAAESAAPRSAGGSPACPTTKPNIVVILADDLGYGDVHCLNPERGKILTPNLDKLAAQGMTFTDAHGSSSVCTPTRYGILTGRYCWRTRLQCQVLNIYGEPLIAADRLTVPSLLKQQGYATAAIGKWHLGFNHPFVSQPVLQKARKAWASSARNGVSGADYKWLFSLPTSAFDWSKPIAGGPTTRGFDYFFGAPFDSPTVSFIENDRKVGLRPGMSPEKTIRHDDPESKILQAEIVPILTEKACSYVRDQAKTDKPFFLYFALTSPHTPLVPAKQWKGKSGLGDYGDYVMETDWAIGQVIKAMDDTGLAGNTLLIVTSDNGCAPYVKVKALEAKGHYPSGEMRGYKSDAWDGGHRIPFMARWPGVTKAGSHSNRLICLNDLMATCAELLSVQLPDNAGEDSVSILPLLRGIDKPVRQSVVSHSFHGKFVLREGNWKLLQCSGSGGWTDPTDPKALKQHLPSAQLYDMSQDIGERKNLQAEHPDIVKRLTAELGKIVTDGRSTPGPKQKNDVPVDIFKKGK